MNREILEQFQGKKVRIVLEPHFVLTGIIEQISEDFILFSTSQKSSIIHFSKIREVYPV